MRKTPIIGAVLLGAIAVALALQSGADAAKKPKLSVGSVYGNSISVPPQDVTAVDQYNLRCPYPYRATGHGVLLGAVQLIYATPSVDGRGYDFAFANPSADTAYDAAGTVTCIRGTGLKVIASSAMSTSAKSSAIRQWKDAHGG
jgi:hypothetical protein